MWKVLLVEDELFFRRRLKTNIHWEEYGFTVCGEASDGLEALGLIDELQPDLVISDIMMPTMDGLELLMEARKRKLTSRFIMLTCVGEFEYARRALEYGASGYLLKLSMSTQDLGETLGKAANELAYAAEQKQELSALKLERFYQKAWERLTGKWDTEDSAGPEIPDFELLKEGRFLVCPIAILHESSSISLDDFKKINLVQLSSQSWIHSYTADGITTFFCWDCVSVQCNAYSPGETDSLNKIVVCGESVPISGLVQQWGSILETLKECWYEGKKGSFKAEPNGPKSIQDAAFEGISWTDEMELIQLFEQGRKPALTECMMTCMEKFKRQKTAITVVKEKAIRLDRIFVQISMAPPEEVRLLNHTLSHQELFEVLLLRAHKYLEFMQRMQSNWTNHQEINKVILYAYQNYGHHITLKSMSKMVAMEEHYLSRLFKHKTGDTLINFVQKIRVDKAKLLLLETDLSIRVIGESVGFPNDNYFVKIFKRWAGHTPGQFRKEGQAHSKPREEIHK